jgi:hypothetical protein
MRASRLLASFALCAVVAALPVAIGIQQSVSAAGMHLGAAVAAITSLPRGGAGPLFAPLPPLGRRPLGHAALRVARAFGQDAQLVGAVLAAPTAAALTATSPLLVLAALLWMLGFVGRSSRTRGQPGAVAIA